MASASSSPQAMQHNRPRPTVPKAIVPAIPLPYIQKRKQQVSARQQAKEGAAQTHVIEEPSSPSPPPPEIVPAIVNGSSDAHNAEKLEEVDEVTRQALAEVPATTRAAEEELREVANKDSEVSIQDKMTGKHSLHSLGQGLSLERLHNNVKVVKKVNMSDSAPSEMPSSASRSTFHMPPAFVPANQSQSNTTSFNPVKFPPQQALNGQSMHHAHASAGSVAFGGYPESNNSSPAPPLSAGNVPPYPFQQQPQIGRQIPHPSNGTHPQPRQFHKPRSWVRKLCSSTDGFVWPR
jgi:hypothetical protein